MIKHIVFFSAKESKNIGVIKETLLSYKNIPDVLKIEVLENEKLDKLSNEIDIVLIAEFNSKEDMQKYKQHPLYQKGIEIIRPLRDKRFVVDCEL